MSGETLRKKKNRTTAGARRRARRWRRSRRARWCTRRRQRGRPWYRSFLRPFVVALCSCVGHRCRIPLALPSSPQLHCFDMAQEEDLQLVVQRSALMSGLQQRSASVALSVWTATSSSPTDRRLILYNESYKSLCDVTSFGEGRLEDCMPSGVFFLSTLLARNYAAFMVESEEKFAQVLSGETTFVSSSHGYHLSKLGRLQPVSIEWHLLRSSIIPWQVLIAEFIDTPKPATIYNQQTDDEPSIPMLQVHLKKTIPWTNWSVKDGSLMLKRRSTSDWRCQVCKVRKRR